MDASQLSDSQVYALAMNKGLCFHVSKVVNTEFKKRNFDADMLYKLDLELRTKIEYSDGPLSLKTKLAVVAFPFFIIIIAFIANRHIVKNPRKWNQYWLYTEVGHAVWFVILMLTIRLHAETM
jgi:hypothetical protein